MLCFFKCIRKKNSAKKLAFLTQNKAKLCKKLIMTLVFEKNAIFCQKLAKIAKNCDHNIDPSRNQRSDFRIILAEKVDENMSNFNANSNH
jgi:hypothetical protein